MLNKPFLEIKLTKVEELLLNFKADSPAFPKLARGELKKKTQSAIRDNRFILKYMLAS